MSTSAPLGMTVVASGRPIAALNTSFCRSCALATPRDGLRGKQR